MNPPSASGSIGPQEGPETAVEPDDQVPVAKVVDKKQTLPPPEWSAPRSVSSIALDWLSERAPVPRRRGTRANLASLRALFLSAGEEGDAERERQAAASLARALAAQGVELDAATKLAR